MTIQQYISKVKEEHEYAYINQSAAEVLLKKHKLQPDNWQAILQNAGFYNVDINMTGTWSDIHRWCLKNIGSEHYTWTGGRFWFETEHDAVLFALKWA